MINGCHQAQRQDNSYQIVLLYKLHISQSSELGVVLPQHDPRRLQPLHHIVETLHKYADTGRGGNIGSNFNDILLR